MREYLRRDMPLLDPESVLALPSGTAVDSADEVAG